MACILNTSQNVFVIVGIFLWMGQGSATVSISINPEKTIATLETAVDISCVPDSGDDMKKDIAMLEIFKNEGQLMAAVRPCSNITYGSDVADRIQVSGHIDEDVRKSHLNITLTYPVSQDTGKYTCSMHYLKQTVLKEERKSKDLQVQNLNVSSLETALNGLKERVTIMEEDGMKRVMEKINNLENTVTYTSAFTATTSSVHTFPLNKKPVVFPKVLMTQGEGYDPRTGMFTAPREGLYFFSVTALTWTGDHIKLELKANGKALARLYVDAQKENTGDQSSISIVTHLAVGDVVEVFALHVFGKSRIYRSAFSLFTGYLIKPLTKK